MEDKLAMRNEVPVELTWDLSLIYENKDAMEADLEKYKSLAADIKNNYPEKLNTAVTIVECLDKYRQLIELDTLIGNYVNLAVETDYYNGENQNSAAKFNAISAQVNSDLSFIDSEISEQSEEVLNKALELTSTCKGYLNEILRKKPHMLHKEAERALAAVSQTLNTPVEIYNTMKLADMKFNNFTANGKSYPLGYSLFEDNYEFEIDSEIRRNAFKAFSEKIKQYENTTAAAYNAYCQYRKTMSNLRGFGNIFEPDLFDDHVNMEMYNRQIDLIMEKLSPAMRKYARCIKRCHKLDKMTYADLKLPLDPAYCPEVTIEKSRDYITGALSILGDDYLSMVNEAYDNRWVDFAKNQGKSTGGFCASPYGKGSFILMSWNDKMSDALTLVHELGHAGHFRLCNANQSIFDTYVSGYFIEAPSTMNEMIMNNYLLTVNDDPRFRRWVLSNMVGTTYYHNFVTHLLEAAYQREVYKLVDTGENVNAEVLSKIFKDILTQFWGDDVELTEGAELTWMRQPHYYAGLYSYTYSAGLTIATEMCKRIKKEGATAVEDWKNVLKAGSTLDPVGLAALGGIDITTDEALLDTIATISSYIDEICELTEQLEK